MARALLFILTICILILDPIGMTSVQAQQEEAHTQLPPIDRAAARTKQGARDLAIVIAVENYHNLSGIPGAVQTGMDWKVFFSEHLGLGEERVLFLKDNAAFPAKLKREIPEFLKKADKTGRVWFVFIGHGAPYQAVEGTAQVSDGLLVGVNAMNDTYADFIDGSLRKADLEKMLAAGNQKQTVMILDACFSGKTPFDQNLTGTQAVIPTRLFSKVKDQDIVFSAAEYNEVANLLPGNVTKRPAFSYALLGAFRGWADRDGDKKVTLLEAETYVQRMLLGLQTPSATVKDTAVRKQTLVDNAPESDPGATALIQGIITGAKSYATKTCDTKGKVRNADTQGNCCWPGQGFSTAYNACVGSPMCPDGTKLGDNGECQKATGEQTYAGSVDQEECTSGARCTQIGDDAYFGRSGKLDINKAAKFYEKACEFSDARGCMNIGVLYENGRGVAKDPARAAKLYAESCDLMYSDACINLAVMYDNARGVAKDQARAAKLYEKACNNNAPHGCANLGFLYDNGQGVPQDQAHAATLYKKACDGGYFRGCFNLGVSYEKGRGVAQDHTRAFKLYETACLKGNTPACYNLAVAYDNGQGVAQNSGRAAQLYDRVCNRDHGPGCYNLGVSYENGEGVAQDKARAATLYKKACVNGYAAACNK